MILVAKRLGFSIWLITCDAASTPNWKELISMDVSGGALIFATIELLKLMIERSSGTRNPSSKQTCFQVNAMMSSLTTTAVGRSGCSIYVLISLK